MKPPSETATVTARATPRTVSPVRTTRLRRFFTASAKYRRRTKGSVCMFAFISASLEVDGACIQLVAIGVRDDLSFNPGGASLVHGSVHRDVLKLNSKLSFRRREEEVTT